MLHILCITLQRKAKHWETTVNTNKWTHVNNKKNNLSWKKATLIPQPKLYFMAIWSCWFPHFFLSLQRLHCIQSHINSQTKGNKACNRGENSISQLSLFYKMISFLRLNISVYSRGWAMKTVRTDSQGSAGDPSLLIVRACRSSPEASSFSRALRRPHSRSAYAPWLDRRLLAA